jgi:Protein of unknown function (DUF1194)
MKRFMLILGLWFGSLLSPLAQQKPQIDIALVLAVDVSFSMDPEEQQLQRDGYYTALRSKEVIEAIKKGAVGKIAVAYVEWAGVQDLHLVVDWHIIEDEATAENFVRKLQAIPYKRAWRTSISGGIDFSLQQFDRLPFTPTRRVIDVSGDGANNDGQGIERTRDKVVEQNVIINGLPIMLKRPNVGYMDINYLDDYYTDCVIGGAGSFMLPIRTPQEFLSATKQKLILEIANIAPRITLARNKVDCFIGEKLRRERWGERF